MEQSIDATIYSIALAKAKYLPLPNVTFREKDFRDDLQELAVSLVKQIYVKMFPTPI